MAQESNHTPMLCTMGCGFYGNPGTSGMCSVCYKEHLQRQKVGLGGGEWCVYGCALLCACVLMYRCVKVYTPQSPQGETASCRRVVVSPIQASIPQQSPVSVSAGSSTTGPVTQQMTAMTITPEVSADQSDTGKEDGDEQGEEEEDVEEEEASKDPADGVDVTQESSEGDQTLDKGRKSNRCFACRKKVGLTGFDCRCGNLFCCAHRYSDKHECPYDYRSAATTRLRKENPVVVAEKIQKL